MVILRKLDARSLSIEAYEQYGRHEPNTLATTYAWASRNSARYSSKGENK